MSVLMKSYMAKSFYISVVTNATISGILIDLSYILTFEVTPIYGTLIILILVNIIHYFSSPYLMMHNYLSAGGIQFLYKHRKTVPGGVHPHIHRAS